VNRSAADLVRNRRPDVAILGDPGEVLRRLADDSGHDAGRWAEWKARIRTRDTEREEEIRRRAAEPTPGGLNPLALCRAIDEALDEDSVLIADGGDFVATASYVVRPRGPLRWLDPGVFGTLGVGGGFALGAASGRPGAEVWLLWGDGSAAFSLAEVDTFSRHGRGMIAVIGNDASWGQIARDQVEILGDDVGTVLARTDYHQVAEGYGGVGLELREPGETAAVLAAAKGHARRGRAVVVNAHLGVSDFRKGSLSI
jgi:acetolactate synthase-1/2/3 large subunit